MTRYYEGLLFFLFLSFVGCNVIDPPEKVPSFIQIDSISLDANFATQGSSDSLGISDVWLTIDGELIGVFELPATIPILKEGQQELTIEAGVKKNGMNGERIKYPYYQKFVVDTVLIPDSIIKVHPVVKYETFANVWHEDFESAALNWFKTDASDVSLITTNNQGEVYEGNGSGYAEIAPNELFEITTDETDFDNTQALDVVFVELTYSTSYETVVGISFKKDGSSVDAKLPHLYLRPTDTTGGITWNKIFIEMNQVVQPNAPYDDLDFFIGIQNTGEKNAKIYLDNIKIVKN